MLGQIMVPVIIFFMAVAFAMGSGIMVVCSKNPVHSALWMVSTLFSTAIIYLLLGFDFVAAIQVIVYAGAIMMLIVYVIMLTSLDEEVRKKYKLKLYQLVGIAFVVIFFIEALKMGTNVLSGWEGLEWKHIPVEFGTVKYIAYQLFSKYVFPFEVISILLLAAIAGSVFLAKKDKKNQGDTNA
jgi:NADH-quinone oxidoreductase subunit J